MNQHCLIRKYSTISNLNVCTRYLSSVLHQGGQFTIFTYFSKLLNRSNNQKLLTKKTSNTEFFKLWNGFFYILYT